MIRDTGLTRTDAKSDFTRERRRRALAKIASRLRSEPSDVDMILPFEEVLEALGHVSERSVGVQSIDLDSIVGTVDRSKDFDRAFRPTSARVRQRWERMAAAARRGESFPPITVKRIGELHFVQDGHHRVSVARAQGDSHIDAHVVEIKTKIGANRELRLRDLPLKRHERVFFERIPLPPQARARIQLSDEWRYARLGDLIEAWGYRASHDRGRLLSREEMAESWFKEEYCPVVEALAEARAGGGGTETERYLRIAMLRYLLLHTHDWSDDVVDRLLGEARRPGIEEDTMVHQLLKEMG